jgi:hypothetical protein
MTTNKEYIKRWASKLVVVNWLGGKCCKCGESKLPFLEFHHTRDKVRPLFFGNGSIDTDEFKRELEKCIVLCKRCHQEERLMKVNDRILFKERLMKMTGHSSCSICGYRGVNIASLEFHHRDKSAKSFNIGTVCRGNVPTIPLEDVIEEVKKCDVLCSNCHVSKHVNVKKVEDNIDEIRKMADNFSCWRKLTRRVDNDELLNLYNSGKTVKEIAKLTNFSKSTISVAMTRLGIPTRQKKKKELAEYTLKCIVCGSDFVVKGERERDSRKCCSSGSCANRMAGYKKRPLKEDVLKMVSESSVDQASNFYGVHFGTIYRWMKEDRWVCSKKVNS